MYIQMQPSSHDEHIDVVTTLIGIVIQQTKQQINNVENNKKIIRQKREKNF
jgi:hypothetical protein